MTQLSEVAGTHTLRIPVPAAMASASTDDETVGVVVPFNCTVTAARWVPAAAVTANGTNYTTVGVRNRGAAGSGSALPATRSYAATNSVAFVAEAMTLSATASDLLLNAGDVLTLQRVHTAAGVSVPAGSVDISVKIR